MAVHAQTSTTRRNNIPIHTHFASICLLSYIVRISPIHTLSVLCFVAASHIGCASGHEGARCVCADSHGWRQITLLPATSCMLSWHHCSLLSAIVTSARSGERWCTFMCNCFEVSNAHKRAIFTSLKYDLVMWWGGAIIYFSPLLSLVHDQVRYWSIWSCRCALRSQ